MYFNKFIICADPLFTSELEQSSVLNWFFDLIKFPLSKATNGNIIKFISKDYNSNFFNRKTFFDKSDYQINLDDKQTYFNPMEIKNTSEDYFIQHFGDCTDTLIIGYEFSNETKEILDRLNYTYIDIWLHPVRFMDDILFAFKSNNKSIMDKLFNHKVDDDYFYLYANKTKIKFNKQNPDSGIKENSALFVGQMYTDKSIFKNGLMTNITHFKSEFEDLCNNYSTVYYARHPYIKQDLPEVTEFLNSFTNVEIATLSSYEYLSSPNVSKICGISSSVVSEAKYFNKNTEFFLGPNVPYGNTKNDFISIYNEFVSPHFWSDILSNVVDTIECKKLEFFNTSNTLRNTLKFYWSYGDIDESVRSIQKSTELDQKTRQLEIRVNNTERKLPKVNTMRTRNTKINTEFHQTYNDIKELKEEIDKHDTISFDIFDTLIERKIENPSDIYLYLSSTIKKLYPEINNFIEKRKESKKIALEYGLNTFEEVTLENRYIAMGKFYDIPYEKVMAIYQEELNLEYKFCKPRFIGLEALKYAQEKNKRIILTSDTFFDRTTIINLLDQCNIKNYDKLYLSSEIGYLKHTGNIYPILLEKESKYSKNILHIGDNYNSDILNSGKYNISSFYIPSKNEIFSKTTHYDRLLKNYGNNICNSAIKGLISSNYTKEILKNEPGFINGSQFNFGYNITGPMFFGFTQWLIQEVKKSKIKDIYFLARDGDILKKTYDILTQNDYEAPKSHYLLASRRSTRVASISNNDDIINLLNTNFTPMSLNELAKNRFGINLENIKTETFEKHGFKSATDIADMNTNSNNVINIFCDPDVFNIIKDNANMEKSELLKYYKTMGLTNLRNGSEICFVDIGHAGSIQKSICEIINIKDTLGLYFATEITAHENLKNHRYNSFAGYNLPLKSSHKYKQHILMYEICFLNGEDSFVKIKDGTPIFLTESTEKKRKEFVKNLHDGIITFISDIHDTFDSYISKFNIDQKYVLDTYHDFLTFPEYNDAIIFDNIYFENYFSGRKQTYILGKNNFTTGIWPEGKFAILNKKKTVFTKKTIYHIIKFIQGRKKADKFLRNSKKYFRDMIIFRNFSKTNA